MITEAEFLGKFFTDAIKNHTMENWSSFHVCFLKACSHVLPLQCEAPRNCIDKTVREKESWKTYLKRWGKGEKRDTTNQWNSRHCIHQSKETNLMVHTKSKGKQKVTLWCPPNLQNTVYGYTKKNCLKLPWPQRTHGI